MPDHARTPVAALPPFIPDSTRSLEENVMAFWRHLEAADPAFATILRDNLPKLSPLPPSGQGRTAARRRFHEAIGAALDAERDSATSK